MAEADEFIKYAHECFIKYGTDPGKLPEQMRIACQRGAESLEKQNRLETDRITAQEPFHKIGTYSNMTGEDYRRNKLGDIERERRPYMLRAVELVEKWHPGIDQGFYLWGNVGSGKSRLLRGLCLKWSEKHRWCQFWPVGKLMVKFKEFDRGSEHLTAFRNSLLKADILVIDDLGSEYATEFVQTELLHLIDARTNLPGSLHISSNIPPNEVKDAYGIRFSDRLKQLTKPIAVKDESYRGTATDTEEFWHG